MKKVEFYKHHLSAQDKQAMLDVADSLFLSTGPVVAQFEKKFAGYLGVKHAVGVMSCTHALELSLRYFGIGKGDEVITTPLSFIASSNSIEYVGATPVFVDVDPTTGNIDEDKIEAKITPHTKAILPVHLYGQMCDMKKLRAIADKHNLVIIEDCAHAVESSRDGIKPGQLSDAACFSFYATKNLACGEGGAITCNDTDMYEWLLQGRLHGMSKGAADRYQKKYEHYDMTMLGMKCNMSNLQASLLINQIDKLDEYLEMRKELHTKYSQELSPIDGVAIPAILANSVHAHHLYTILVDPDRRDAILHQLQDRGIGVAVNFRPIHLMTYYKQKYGYKLGDFPNAEKIGASTITLPLYAKLTDDERMYVVQAVTEIARGYNKN